MSSRELDAAVAEKVMGLKPCLMFHDWKEELQAQLSSNEGHIHDCPRYSTSIEAAWEVVERMRKDGWFVDIEGTPKEGWKVTVYKTTTNDFEADAADLPEAACLAALSALASKEGKVGG